MNGRRIAGCLLLIAALLVGTGIVPISGATVTYDTPPVITPLFPSGSASSPFPLVKGQNIQFTAYISPADSVAWASCQVLDGNGNSLVIITLIKDQPTLAIVNDGDGGGSSGGTNFRAASFWICPSVDGATYTFRFKAANTAGQISTVDVPGVVPTGQVLGQFYINGQVVNTDSRITVSDPALQLKFRATAYGNLATGVQVQLRDYATGLAIQTVPLSESSEDVEWTGALTLPDKGTYTIVGTVFQNNQYFTLMSVVADMGGEPASYNTIIALILGALGAALFISPKKSP